MFSVLCSSSPLVYGTLFPIISGAAILPHVQPLPPTLAWHVAAYALDVVAGRRILTKAMADAYLDEVSFAGGLRAKRPSSAAFVAMIRAHITDFGAPSDPGHAPEADRRVSSKTSLAIATDGYSEYSAYAFAPTRTHAANDNAREG